MNIRQSSESLVFKYRTLRLIIGGLAFAFPAMVIALTGKITTSISASYHEAATRDVFVGFMFIFGALLVSYKGHPLEVTSSRGGTVWVRIQRYQEDWISGAGGIAAILAGLYPTACDGCSLGTTATVHTIGALLLFFNVFYFSLIAFLRSLNKKLQAYPELQQIQKVAVNENAGLFGRFTDFLFCEIFLFRRLLLEVSRRYDEGEKTRLENTARPSVSHTRAKIAYFWSAYQQKIRRGCVYVLCGFLIFLVLLGYLLASFLRPDLITFLKITFVVEAISLWLFATAWMTASRIPYLRKIRLLLALRPQKQAMMMESGTT